MPSTFTTNNGIEKPAEGEQNNSWGDTANSDFDLIDQSLDGAVTVSLTGTTSNLAITSGAVSDGRNRVIIFNGTLSANHTVTITPNDAEKWYFITNSTTGGYSVIIKQGSGSGTTVTILNGYSKMVRVDGTGTNANVSEVMPNPYFGGTVVVAGTLGVAGAITGSVDSSFNGVTVGRGSGSIASNTTVGSNALIFNTTGIGNTATGSYAGWQLTTGSYNTAIGYASAFQTTGSYNTTVGYTALYASAASSGNTAVGYTALNLTTGSNNTGIGNTAGAAITTGTGNVVIGCNDGTTIATATNNIILADGSGNVRMRVTSAGDVGFGVVPTLGALQMASGAYVTAGGTWTNASDVALKQSFAPVDSASILDAVTALNVDKWEYKAEPGVVHIGPTAQDFKALFGVGANDTSISTVDAIGVLLSAVKELAKKVKILTQEESG